MIKIFVGIGFLFNVNQNCNKKNNNGEKQTSIVLFRIYGQVAVSVMRYIQLLPDWERKNGKER